MFHDFRGGLIREYCFETCETEKGNKHHWVNEATKLLLTSAHRGLLRSCHSYTQITMPGRTLSEFLLIISSIKANSMPIRPSCYAMVHLECWVSNQVVGASVGLHDLYRIGSSREYWHRKLTLCFGGLGEDQTGPEPLHFCM